MWFKKYNVLQKDLAQSFGLTGSRISAFCTGDRKIPKWMRYALAGYLLERKTLEARAAKRFEP